MKWPAAGSLALLILGLTDPAVAGPSGLRQFGDWIVGCDNTLHCRAIGLQADGPDEVPYFVLDRDGGPDAAPRFHLGGDVGVDSGLAWKVDDKPPVSIPESAVSSPPAAEEGGQPVSEVVDASAVSALLAAMRDGQEVRFAAKTEGLAKASPVPLKGLAATLLFMDDVQGRVGTLTALSKPGKKPASAVPPAPALPLIIADPIPDQAGVADEIPKEIMARHLKSIGKDTECEDYGGADQIPTEQYRLAGDRILYLVGCWRAAYQAGSVAYIAKASTPSKATPLLFETIDEKTGKLDATMKSATDPNGPSADSPLLTSLHKGRGVGGCGIQWNWAWSAGHLRLTAYQSMPACHTIDEEHDWITLWRSRDK